MAFEEYDKYEQSELVQKWLRENGLSIVVGVAIGLVGIFGWQQWNKHQARNQAEAAHLYQQAQVASLSGKPEQSAQFIEEMKKDYAKSSYTVFAVSDMAKVQLQAKQYDKAKASLAWAVSNAGDPALKSLAQLRMAQAELAGGDAKASLVTLDSIPGTDYKVMVEELRGDVLVKLGRSDDARKAYQTALSSLDDGAPLRGVLQLKIDDLAKAGKQGA